MGKVATGFSTSLDGFIAHPNDDIGPLFDWYFAGDTEYTVPGGNFTLRVCFSPSRTGGWERW